MKASGQRAGLVLWAALAIGGLVGCGGDEDATVPFLGEWQFTSGTSNTKCPTLAIDENDQLVGDKFRISKGIDAPLVYSESGTNCTWKMTPNGSVANVTSGQSCTFTNANGITFMVTYTAGTISVTGTTAQYSGSQSATANFQGATHNCTSTGSGGLSKIAQ
jgi:hypothetical protein